MRILTETIVAPTLIQQLRDFLAAFPRAQWHQYEPLARDIYYRGAVLAFGQAVNTHYDFTKADVVVSLDSDFLSCGPGHLRYVGDFMSRRRVRTSAEQANTATMNRLYMIETTVSTTGAKADHRWAVKPSEIETLAWRRWPRSCRFPASPASATSAEPARKWLRAVADDLRQPGRRAGSLVVAGDRQPPIVHLLAHAMNRRLGNVGHTVLQTRPVEAQPALQTGQGEQNGPVERVESLRRLVHDMEAGRVAMLLILGGNPVFNAPADFNFTQKLQRVPLRIHLSLFQDETSRQCHWHLPEAHYLEAWSDTRAYDGTVSIAQPLIEPLYAGRSAHELLTALTPMAGLNWRELPGDEIVKGHWRAKNLAADFETFWQETVHDGVMGRSAFGPDHFAWKNGVARARAAYPPAAPAANQAMSWCFDADPTIHDGRFANNGWLQELPKPLTELTWDNAALMSPATARRLGVALGQLCTRRRTWRLPSTGR